MLAECGLAGAIFPGISSSQTNFGIRVLNELPKKADFALALACFFSDCNTRFTLDECKILKLSRNTYKHIAFLLDNRGRLLNEKMSLADLKKILANPYFRDLFEMQKAIQKASTGCRKSIIPLIKLKRRIKELGDIELQPKPFLNGHDLIRIGAVSGPLLGRLAQELYVAQLEGIVKSPHQAIQWVKQWLDKHRTNQT